MSHAVRNFSRSADSVALLDAPIEDVFAYLDEHRNLSAHMDKPSPMMLGARMELYADAAQARAVGSEFGFRGSLLGVPLAVHEVVSEREPPRLKVWETVGEPRLWVIGAYRMAFDLEARRTSTRLRVSIAYDLPERGLPRLLGAVFGKVYARWCTSQMVHDAEAHFAARPRGHLAAA